MVSQNSLYTSTKFAPQRRNFPHSGKIWSGIYFFSQKKCLTLKMKSTAIPPSLLEKLIPPGEFLKIPEWNISKKSSAKIQDQTNFHSKILNFTNLKFFPKFHLLKSHGKKSEIFAKASRWKVNGNEHSIFNYIIDPDGNDFLPYEDLEIYLIDDFKRFSLAYNELNLPRKRFLNCHHVLFWLLKKNGFHPNEEDFKLLTLPQKRAEQEKIIQTIFKKYNWKENGLSK